MTLLWIEFAVIQNKDSSNAVAIRTLKSIYPHFLDIGCFSHTIDLVGEHFKVPVLEIRSWISWFSHSPRTRSFVLERANWQSYG